MNYWLIKSEPSVFSIDEMKTKKVEPWNGVRNYQARNFMKEMQTGDLCFFYHSNAKETGIVGLVKVVREHYPDPDDTRFVCVDVEYQKHIPLLSLKCLKEIKEIEHLALFHQSRLSVQPIDDISAKIILSMASQ
jgi:predicted RNA-binding protein with PUA-like domain